MWIMRKLGFDQSHMVVWGAKKFLTRTVIPPEWDLARAAFFRTIEKCLGPVFGCLVRLLRVFR